MLAIRLQRTGRKGHAQFRILVQDSRLTPTSGRFVAHLGSYDPHAKTVKIDKEKAALYLSNGARPSDRVARMLQKEGVKLPSWVKLSEAGTRATRNPEKLRKNQPAQPKAEEKPETPAPENPEATEESPATPPDEEAKTEEASKPEEKPAE